MSWSTKKNFLALTVLLVLTSVAGLRMYWHAQIRSPLDEMTFSTRVMDRRGQLLRFSLSGDEKYRLRVNLKDISSKYVEAVLLSEDRHFYLHPGVNPISLARAMLSLWSGHRMGASTITMQLVRMQERLKTKTLNGKLAQIAKALWFEFIYSKDAILEAYLNLVPFGANIEGVGAASFLYFDIPPSSLSLGQSLLLAVVPQNPNERTLTRFENNQSLRNRTFEAAGRLGAIWMKSQSTNPKEIISEIKKIEINEWAQLANSKFENRLLAPHWVQMILSQDLIHGEVRTTLDLELQRKVDIKLRRYLSAKKNMGIQNGAVLIVDSRNREILSWIGSGDFENEEIQGQVDGILAKRSPGSTLKPFVYAEAIDEGIITPNTLLKDTPTSFGGFDPENFDRNFKGPLSATEALIQSRNIPAVNLSMLIRKQTLYTMLKRAGIVLPRDEKFYGLGVTLGAVEISMLDLARLYVGLVNRGQVRDLKFYMNSSFTDKRANDGIPHRTKDGVPLFSAESAFLTLDMLRKNPREESMFLREWDQTHNKIAWKTGTSFGFRDAWTIGAMGDYVIAVWLGNFDNAPNNALIGREMAAPLFFELTELLSKGPTEQLNQNPEWAQTLGLNLKKVHVCAVSGALASATCPHKVVSWFIPGKSSIKACDIHREILISKKTGLRICNAKQNNFRKKVFEFWPSDLLQLFKKGGLARQAPPDFEPGCTQTGKYSEGMGPQIVSPKNEVDYLIDPIRINNESKIPFRAIVEADVKKLFWFVNNVLVAESSGDETIFYSPQTGKFEVLVVDDKGRSDSRLLKVHNTISR